MRLRTHFCRLLIAPIALGVASCATGEMNESPIAPEALGGAPATADMLERSSPSAATLEQEKLPAEAAMPASDVFVRGRGLIPRQSDVGAMTPPSDSTDTVTANFQETDIRQVLQSVLGEMLRINYTVDPAVRGNVTFQSSAPIRKDAVLSALQAALRLQGTVLVESGGTMRAVPAAEAQRQAGVFRGVAANGSLPPGYSLQIVPLQYASAAEIAKVLDPIVPKGSIVYIDPARNILLAAGTDQELRAILDLAATFDVDWLRGMSFGLFAAQNAQAGDIAAELSKVFDGPQSPVRGIVQMVPIPRINSLLVFTPQPDYLEEVQQWINRLDTTQSGPQQRIFYYQVQNAKAEDLANSLNQLFGSGLVITRSPARATPSRPPLSARPSGLTSITNPAPARPETPIAPEQPSNAAEMNPDAASGEASGPRIVIDEQSNALMIRATKEDYDDILQALQQIDVPPDQVLIEATIAEVTLNDDLRYGLQWYFGRPGSRATFSTTNGGAVAGTFPGYVYTYTGTDVRVVLDALSSITNVSVISAPKLLVTNNQPALLQVGDQVPIATQSAISTLDPNAPIINTIQFRDTGVILEVTPRINRSGAVNLEVTQEVSDVAKTTTSGIDSPTIQQRRISSNVLVADGQTVALGGLIRNNEGRTRDGLPFLSDIPVLGHLFRSDGMSMQRTELLIFMRAKIVHNTEEAAAVTDYLRAQMSRMKGLLGVR